MAKLETGPDVLAAMMADAMVCNKRMVRDHPNAMGHECFKGRSKKPDTLPKRIIAELERHGGWIGRAELADALGATRKHISVEAGILVKHGQAERRYIPNPTGSGTVVQWKRKEGGA